MVKDNDIYYKSSLDASPDRLTDDGIKGSIYNGIPDWVYEGDFLFYNVYKINITSTCNHCNSRIFDVYKLLAVVPHRDGDFLTDHKENVNTPTRYKEYS